MGGRVFQRTAGLTPGSTVENVLVEGRARGYVMRRSAHFLVWAEAGEEVHAAGDTLPWAQITGMWEGPRGAAISDDEQWCVVIGLGFVAFPLRSSADLRQHWRYPRHQRWELHLPMKGDLADAVMFTRVQPLDGHRFALSTRWGLGNGWTTREWIYDADTDTIGDPHDIVNEEVRRQAVRTERSAHLAAEPQLVAPLRGDGAETTAEAGTTFVPNPDGGERVLAKGQPVGYVLCRSPRFVVWQELGSMICLEGDGLPWLLLEDMYGGAGAAAISDDEEWCVVVGCGFRARRLSLGGEFRSHGADPNDILWLSEVEAVSGHTFRLRGGAAGFVVREYLYNADGDEFRQVREWIDEERRARSQLMDAFEGLRLAQIHVEPGGLRLVFGDKGNFHITFTDRIRVGATTYDLHTDAERSGAREALTGVVGNRVRRTSTSRFSARDGSLDLQMNPPGRDSEPGSLHNPSFCIDVPTPAATGAWSVSTPSGTLVSPGDGGWPEDPHLQNRLLARETSKHGDPDPSRNPKLGKGPVR
jgi:hypothetical protein